MYGVMSPNVWRSNAAYAVPASKRLASTQLTHDAFGTPCTFADDVRPVLAAVARDLDVAVVGADPDHVRVLRRFADRIDRRVHLGRRVVDGDAAGFLLLLLLRIVRGQIRRDAIPAVAVIARAEQELRADVDRRLLRSGSRAIGVFQLKRSFSL